MKGSWYIINLNNIHILIINSYHSIFHLHLQMNRTLHSMELLIINQKDIFLLLIISLEQIYIFNIIGKFIQLFIFWPNLAGFIKLFLGLLRLCVQKLLIIMLFQNSLRKYI